MSFSIIHALSILISYLIGAISSSIIIARIMKLPDPRNLGSGNPGATNMLRTGSKQAAAFTLLGDLLKGVLPLLIARGFNFDIQILCFMGVAAVVGHMYPIYYRFKGGKGVATTLGVLIGIYWPLALIWSLVWLITARLSGYSSLAALTAITVLPVSAHLLNINYIVTLTCFVIALLVIWRHRSNIKNLLSGKEDKIKSNH